MAAITSHRATRMALWAGTVVPVGSNRETSLPSYSSSNFPSNQNGARHSKAGIQRPDLGVTTSIKIQRVLVF